MEFQAISMKEIEKYMCQPNTWLIDLRTKEEYDRCHIEGARCIPYDDLEKYKKYIPKNNAYILYCERGVTSLLAAKELSKEGFKVYTAIGGLKAWEEQRLN